MLRPANIAFTTMTVFLMEAVEAWQRDGRCDQAKQNIRSLGALMREICKLGMSSGLINSLYVVGRKSSSLYREMPVSRMVTRSHRYRYSWSTPFRSDSQYRYACPWSHSTNIDIAGSAISGPIDGL